MRKYRLGRKPARATLHSLRRMKVMIDHLNALGPAPATSPDWVSAVMKQSPGGWLMDGNDTYGDCVIADCAHQEMLRTANAGGLWVPAPSEVLALYAYFQGMNIDPGAPLTPAGLAAIEQFLAHHDDGCDELTVIEYLTKTGWLGRKLSGSANLDPRNMDQLKWAVCIFGACRLGINLPDSAQTQFDAYHPWSPVKEGTLAGGHDVPIVGYDADYFYVVTWGKLQAVEPAFMTATYSNGMPYVEEAHAELALDWVNAVGTCPAGLSMAQLVADLSGLVDPNPGPIPSPTPTPVPPVGMSKRELYKMIRMAINSDLANAQMTVEEFAADIANICRQVTG